MSCIDVSMIIEVCDGMLQLEPAAIFHKSGRPVISFTHASVADFLSQELVIDDIHLDFANTSLGYVSMQGLQAEDIRHIHHTQYQFLNYAMSNWADHASRSIGDIKVEFLLAFARKSPRALIEAARRGLHDALHFLLDNGISPNRYHKTHSPLSIAATYGQLLCASYLVEAGAHVDYAGDHNQLLETALTLAIRSGHSQVVLLLIDSNADLNAGRMPPIFAAVLSNRPTIVRKLLSAGCDPDVRYEGRTAIMTALDKGRLGIAETLILGGADLHARYGVGNETLLSKAMWHRSWDFAAKLIDQGADAKNDTSLVQLLKPAAYEGAEELVQQILQVAGHRPSPSVEEEDEAKTASTPASAHSYKTPLHLALEGRHHDIAMQLIRSGLGINRLCGTPPYTPLEWTAGHNNVELVKELITAGADPNRGGEATPLMSAVSRFVQADNFHDTQTTEVIALLLDAGADPHARSSKETDQLTIQVADNLRFRWWSKSDTNVQRLLISLQLPDSWVVT
jgi:ankyrin repeat protein